MKALIPSYKRPDSCKTALYLNSCGWPKEDIIIGTQTKEDFEAYTESYGDIATITYREAKNCAGNRNNLLEYVGHERVVLMDDDIKRVWRYDLPEEGHGIPTVLEGEELLKALETISKCMDIAGAKIAGTAMHTNFIFLEREMLKRGRWRKTSLLSGMFMVMDAGERVFDESYDCIDDHEYCLRLLANGESTLRACWIVVDKPQDTTNKGGCYDMYQSGKKVEVLKRMEAEYGAIAKVKKDWTGMQLRAGLR